MSNGAQAGAPDSNVLGPPAPGTTAALLQQVDTSHAPTAWQRLMRALGHDLQGGLYRTRQARMRLAARK